MNIVTKDGLEHFWGKVKDKLNTKVDKYLSYKSYENDYMYNSASNNNCTGYDREFAQVVANDWNKPWIVKMLIKTDMFYNGTTHYPTFHEVLIGVDSVTGTTWVRNFNVIDSASYRSAYYITVYRPDTAAKANNAPFRLVFRAGDQSSKTAHPRSYDVYIIEAVNCTCTLNDSLDNEAYQKWYFNDHSVNAYYWSATKDGSFRSINFDISSNGLQETGDADTFAYTVSHYYNYATVGTNGVKRYTIVMQDKDGNYQSIVNEDNKYTVLTKTANTAQFRLNMPMFYYNSSAARNNGTRVAAAELRSIHINADMRYSLNVLADATNRLTAYSKLFLVGTIDDEGYFKLDTTKWWAEGEPIEEDGKVYIYLGIVYPDTNPYRCSVELEYANNAYWFKNGQFRHYPDTGISIESKQDKLTAGNNITIVGNVISSTASGGTSYDDTEVRGLIANKQDKLSTTQLVNINADHSKYLTSHQDISGKADKSSLSTVATSGSYDDLSNKPTIPSAVTESTVSGWGFTKNSGTYSKPSGGIPKTDLASAVQTSLSKADTALQSYTEQYTGTVTSVNNVTPVNGNVTLTIPSAVTESTVSGWGFTKNSGTYSKPSGGIPKTDLASAVQTSLGKADTALQSYTEQYKGTVTSVNSISPDASGNVELSNLGESIAVGCIIPFAGNGDVPAGFLLCNGASISRTTYPALFDVIGYTYGGSGDYFALPNLVDKFIEGGNTVGVTGGEAEHALTIAEMPAHGHNTRVWNNNNQDNVAQKYNENGELVTATSGARLGSVPWISSNLKTAGSGIGDPNGATELMGGGQPHNNLPPFLTMRYIIKAFAGASADSSDIAITNVANELNSFKVQVDNKGFITEDSSNKAEKGFVKFSNGFIVQWGWEDLGTHENRLVTFPTPFSSMNYQITCCGRTTATNTASGVTSHYCQGNSVTNFYLCQDYTSNVTPQWASWIACGF